VTDWHHQWDRSEIPILARRARVLPNPTGSSTSSGCSSVRAEGAFWMYDGNAGRAFFSRSLEQKTCRVGPLHQLTSVDALDAPSTHAKTTHTRYLAELRLATSRGACWPPCRPERPVNVVSPDARGSEANDSRGGASSKRRLAAVTGFFFSFITEFLLPRRDRRTSPACTRRWRTRYRDPSYTWVLHPASAGVRNAFGENVFRALFSSGMRADGVSLAACSRDHDLLPAMGVYARFPRAFLAEGRAARGQAAGGLFSADEVQAGLRRGENNVGDSSATASFPISWGGTMG